MKCKGCGCQFNRKTGKDAMTAIIVYNVVALVVVLLIVLVFRLS